MYIFDLKFKGKKWVQNSDIQKLTTRINLKHLKKNVTQPYPQLKIKTPFLQKINVSPQILSFLENETPFHFMKQEILDFVLII